MLARLNMFPQLVCFIVAVSQVHLGSCESNGFGSGNALGQIPDTKLKQEAAAVKWETLHPLQTGRRQDVEDAAIPASPPETFVGALAQVSGNFLTNIIPTDTFETFGTFVGSLSKPLDRFVVDNNLKFQDLLARPSTVRPPPTTARPRPVRVTRRPAPTRPPGGLYPGQTYRRQRSTTPTTKIPVTNQTAQPNLVVLVSSSNGQAVPSVPIQQQVGSSPIYTQTVGAAQQVKGPPNYTQTVGAAQQVKGPPNYTQTVGAVQQANGHPISTQTVGGAQQGPAPRPVAVPSVVQPQFPQASVQNVLPPRPATIIAVVQQPLYSKEPPQVPVRPSSRPLSANNGPIESTTFSSAAIEELKNKLFPPNENRENVLTEDEDGEDEDEEEADSRNVRIPAANI